MVNEVMVAGDGGKLPSQAAYIKLATSPLGPSWRHGLGPTWFVGGGYKLEWPEAAGGTR